MSDQPVITVSAVVLHDGAGRVLTVRKRGTTAFMLPGGKPEGDESPRQTAVRELREEVHLVVPAERLRLLGRFVAAAANEAGLFVCADVFELDGAVEVPGPGAEIEQLQWLPVDSPTTDPQAVAPLTAQILPLLRGSPAERVDQP